MKVPVLLIIFNRPETERVVFERIREYRPEKLYVAADGPREGKEGEEEKCREARALLRGVDWPCEMKTLFRDHNLGCGEGVSSAITWFFENEEYGIIIEDDVLPSLDFFKICEDALPRYKDEERVMMISAFNPVSMLESSNKMGFIKTILIWGWASWGRAWKNFDLYMEKASAITIWEYIRWFGFAMGIGSYYHKQCLLSSYRKTGNWHTWDYQWVFSIFVNKGLSLNPYVNLCVNIGIGIEEGTHFSKNELNPYENLNAGSISFPLSYPTGIVVDERLNRLCIGDYVRLRKLGLYKKTKKLLHIIKRQQK